MYIVHSTKYFNTGVVNMNVLTSHVDIYNDAKS